MLNLKLIVCLENTKYNKNNNIEKKGAYVDIVEKIGKLSSEDNKIPP